MRLGSFYLGLGLSALFVLAAALSFIWTPYDHEALDIANKLKPPNGAHWLGTDHFGRDIATLIMVGARTSIAVALVAVGIGIVLGVPLGLAAAARRGSWLDEVIMRGNDLIDRDRIPVGTMAFGIGSGQVLVGIRMTMNASHSRV